MKKTANKKSTTKRKARKKPELKFDTNWSYSAAPESTDHIEIKDRYRNFIGGKFVAPKKGKYFDTINPANEKKLSEVADSTKEDVNAAVKAARAAYDNVWSKMAPAERSKYIYRIARMMQERAREFSVIETLDGGKPIRESRDVDVPIAAAHFFYYAGWADKLDYAFPGRKPKPSWRCGTDHSLELPATHGRMENCSCSSYRKYRRA